MAKAKSRKRAPKSPKGKKKLTKEERLQWKKEEAERKAKEDEEIRIRTLEEEEARKEQEELDRIERAKLEAEERVRRKAQLLELDGLWNEFMNNVKNDQSQVRADAKWQRYMLCDGSPDPTIAGEINSYINLSREDNKNVDVRSVLKESATILALINELEHILADTPSEELSEKEVIQYQYTRRELQKLLSEKLDTSSHDLLLRASAQADPETNNLQQVISDDTTTLCMWGNLIKNPRIKSFEFTEVGFLFDIPRFLALSDCAIRVLFQKYDHYSERCASFRPRIKQRPPSPVVIEVTEDDQLKEGDEEGENKEEGETTTEIVVEPSPEEDVMTALRALKEKKEGGKDGEQEEEEVTEEGAVGEDKAEEDDERELYEEPVAVEYEDFDGNEDVIDLRAFQVMGGTFTFNLLNMPPQPKSIKMWTLTQVKEPVTLSYVDYVSDEAEPRVEGHGRLSSATSEKKEEKPSFAVTMRLPEDVYFCEEPQITRWDEEKSHWTVSGFKDQIYNEENRALSVRMFHFGTLCLVMDAYINMPFQSWEVRPRDTDNVVLTIIAAIVEVEIEVKEDMCRLLVPEKPELAHILKKWMTLDELMKKMKLAGVNVFPEEDTFKYVSIQNKSRRIEENVYRQIAMTCSAMAFSWSKWNIEINKSDQIVMQGAEHLIDDHLLEDDWSLYSMTHTRTTKLKMTEFDEVFSDEHAEGTEFHADLYHTTMQQASEVGRDRVTKTSYKFINTMYKLLSTTRLITYS